MLLKRNLLPNATAESLSGLILLIIFCKSSKTMAPVYVSPKGAAKAAPFLVCASPKRKASQAGLPLRHEKACLCILFIWMDS